MRVKIGALCFLVALKVIEPAFAETSSASQASFLPFAVFIDRTPSQPWPGYGVYLGNGLVLTAAHVAGNPEETHPRVIIAGKILPTSPVRVGDFKIDDLTVLRLDSQQLPRNQRNQRIVLCSALPPLNSPVVVVTPSQSVIAHLIRPKILPESIISKYDTLIGNVASTGNSGSGVFDPKARCLLGIVSRKITVHGSILQEGHREAESLDIAKYFVPFTTIRSIIPPDVRF